MVCLCSDWSGSFVIRFNARALLEQVAARAIVWENDSLEWDALRVVHRLFRLKNIFVEEQLQLFIREIDAELLKRVCFKDFKAEDVENANKAVRESALVAELFPYVITYARAYAWKWK